MEPSVEAALRAGAFCYFDRDQLVVVIKDTAASQKFRRDTNEKDILAGLMKTNSALLGARSEQEMLTSILHGIRDLNFDRIRLYTFDGQCMHGKAHVGMSDDFLTIVRPVANDIYMQELLREPHPRVCMRKLRYKPPL